VLSLRAPSCGASASILIEQPGFLGPSLERNSRLEVPRLDGASDIWGRSVCTQPPISGAQNTVSSHSFRRTNQGSQRRREPRAVK
jgi:hypothetical protein